MPAEKTLFIVRHGKSTWEYPSVLDIDRPLKDRGIKDAYAAAERILERGVLPDAMITSPAARAMHTAIIFSRVTGFPPSEIVINQDLYLADTERILEVIRSTDDSRSCLMIFGHNPGFTELVNELSDRYTDNLPTAGVATLRFRTDKWEEISRRNLSGSHIDSPHND